MEKSALIAMSGGVDSSVAALFMLREGYTCAGGTMLLHGGAEGDIGDAASVCARLGMEHHVFDLSREFDELVIKRFVAAYEAGLTPNPCVLCNRTLKFPMMLAAARALCLDSIATGHYAKIERDPASGRYLLKRADYSDKDQTYVLYSLSQDVLAHTVFPLGSLEKSEVRAVAESEGLINARKRDSQDICFIPGGDYGAFMESYTGKVYEPGDYLGADGAILGRHRGAVRYTLGQRRGLGIAMGERVFVTGKDMEKNTVTIGPEAELMRREAIVGGLNFISIPELYEPIRVEAKARYSQKAKPALLSPLPGGKVRLLFDEPQRAMTPGQAAVFYDGDTVVGGGTIEEVR
ncbi:MAG: tRNA 2-thiouridine(34) synthase MnmA [Oscillospiraceae bacterium]|nr:tRNA 2-thiouridine(34) synthase MnmA [Oscillospiraceae bacterium]